MSQVTLTIDGKQISVPPGTTIWEAARQAGVRRIPALCHTHEMDLTPVGVCRVCMVKFQEFDKRKNEHKRALLGASCMRAVEENMIVETAGEDLESTRKTLIEMLLSEHPSPCARHQATHDCELELLGEQYGILKPGYSGRHAETVRPHDHSNPDIAIDHSACIVCDRCARACARAGFNVIGRMYKGAQAGIGFDNDRPMRRVTDATGLVAMGSDCVNCGECMISCPTGAITFTGSPPVEPVPAGGKAGIRLGVDEILGLAVIREARVSSAFVRRSQAGLWVRRYAKGEIICRQGDYGRTAFFINSGKVDIYLEKEVNSQQSNGRKAGFWSRLFSSSDGKRHPAPDPQEKTFVAIETDVVLDLGNPVAQLAQGDFFGEQSCLSHRPRSATVRAAKDTEVIEMYRNYFDVLMRNPEFRAKVDTARRRRAIQSQLAGNRILAGLDAVTLAQLVETATLVRFAPGRPVFSEGDESDAFYLVRFGHVKVQQQAPGGVHTIRYLSPSHVFGEIGLLLEPYRRTTTCTALDEVELVRIDKVNFDRILAQQPKLRETLVARAQDYLRADAQRNARLSLPVHPVQRQASDALKLRYFDLELFQGQSLLVLDLERCTRCDECVKACAATHSTITRMIRDGLRFDKYLVTTACRSCHDPKCLVGCPVDAIHRKQGLPITIENHCVGCGKCAENCPYGNITMHPVLRQDPITGQIAQGRKAAVCDLDNCLGETEDPSCVYACPHNAAQRVDGRKLYERVIPPA